MQGDEAGDCHDSSSNVEGTHVPHWTFNSVFGIVHTKNCSVCRSYIVHLANSNHSGDASFKAALQDRESRISESFLEGVQNGQQLQQDVSMLPRYRKERDEALKNLAQQERELDAAREEIRRLQSGALASQVASGDQVVEDNIEPNSHAKSKASSTSCSPVDMDDDDSDDDLLSPLSSTNQTLPVILDMPIAIKSIDVDQAVPLETGNATIEPTASSPLSPAQLIDSLPEARSPTASLSNLCKTSPPTDPKPTMAPLTPSTSTLPNPATSSQSSLIFGSSTIAASLLPSSMPTPSIPETPLLKNSSVQPSTSSSTSAAHNSSRLTTIPQIQALMSAAHAGNDLALETIKAFCSSMHDIPVNQRTELHHYVAMHWRKPSRVSSGPKQPSFSTDIFIDASPWGIGVVMNGTWIAWKFSNAVSRRGGIDIGWATMLAVEVGLRTVVYWVNLMIHKEGDNIPLFITVRTDHWATKRAIEKRKANKPPRQEVLQRIVDMLSTFNIQLILKPVDAAENPASNPARGVPGVVATMLPFTPIPTYLTNILSLISTNN